MRTKNDMTFILWENAYWIIKNVEFDVCTTYSVCKFTLGEIKLHGKLICYFIFNFIAINAKVPCNTAI